MFSSAQTVLSERVQIFHVPRPGDVLRGKYPVRLDA